MASAAASDITNLKCMTVGDGGVGKTSLLTTYECNMFPLEAEFLPSVTDSYTTHMVVSEIPVSMEIWDSMGHDDYSRVRVLSYLQTSVFVVCFSLASPTSFKNIRTKWYPEVRHHCPGIPMVLVGTKADLRLNPEVIRSLEDSKMEPVSYAMGKRLAEEIYAAKYLECSALNKQGVKEVFEEAALAALSPAKKTSRRVCLVL